MLRQIADGVSVHRSGFVETNAVVVDGRSGVLLIDPGVTDEEMTCLADDLESSSRRAAASFSTHPHWDHLLWHERFGSAPRYGTARCADAVLNWLSAPGARDRIAGSELIPPELEDRVPLDLFGQITALPTGATRVPWNGPAVRIVEHQAHAPGHAALSIEGCRVLVAGDMLSDVLIPLLDFKAHDPLQDHLDALELLEGAAVEADFVVPGHGSVAEGDQIPARIERDRAYLCALRDGETPDDPRLGPTAYGSDWLPGIDERQREQIAR